MKNGKTAWGPTNVGRTSGNLTTGSGSTTGKAKKANMQVMPGTACKSPKGKMVTK